MSIVYNKIFKICNEQDNTVYEVLQDNRINHTFRRSFGPEEIEEWQQLIVQVREVPLQSEPDTVTWALEKSGKFTTASLYKELTFPGIENKEIMSIWRARLPLKIKFFLWSIYSDCIPSAEQLVKRNWPGDEHCKVCGQVETTQHIFFECYLANYCWWTFHDALFWTQTPVTLQHFFNLSSGRGDVPNSKMIFLLACICWSLWLIRNDYVFNNKVITNPNIVVHRSIIFMQKWSILLREKERGCIAKTVDKLSRLLVPNAQD